MYRKLLSLVLSLSLLTLCLAVLPIHGEAEIYDGVVRLHVLASSDSAEDQALKLKVRDAVLEYTGTLLASVDSPEDAEALLSQRLGEVKSVAESALRLEGSELSVSVELGRETYPTRSYADCCFPSGEYTSLRIMLGEARGENWWCVLFPPMCLSAASEEQTAIQAGLTDEQYRLITESDRVRYKLRFKLLELVEEAVRE